MKVSATLLRILVLILLCVLAFAAGCGTTTVILKEGDPVRIRADVKAKIWVRNAEGEWVPSKAVLPAGWYCLADPGE